MNYSEIGEQNDFQGELTQKLVAEWIHSLTGLGYIIQDTHGIDIISGDYRIEVKSIESLVKRNKRPKADTRRVFHYQLRSFKIHYQQMHEELTHYAFVFQDKLLIPKPVILMVDASKVSGFVKPKGYKNEYHIPIWWVLENYNWQLSKYGDKLSLLTKH